jgi:hypothetical protein
MNAESAYQSAPSYPWCIVCRHREPFDLTDLDRFRRAGWSVCCGRKVFCAATPERTIPRKK